MSLLNKQLAAICRTLDVHRINKNNAFFFVNSCLTKQIDVCPMSGTVSVAFLDSYKYEMGEDVVVTAKRILYKRYDNGISITFIMDDDNGIFIIILGMNYFKN